MRVSTFFPYAVVVWSILTLTCSIGLGPTPANAQQSTPATPPQSQSSEQLAPVEIEAPRADRRQTQARTGTTDSGFGTGDPIPSGQPGSDYPLTPGEVVSTGGRPQNLANVPSAVSIIQNRGVESLGYTGVPNMIQGQPGVYTSGYSATPFDSAVVLRGFSSDPGNRVSLLYDGRTLNTPLGDANWMSIFPELIDRIEILRGDGTVQFGQKAIGGTVNIIPKRPRQNPGTFWGAEMGSWQTDREWVASNMVRGPVAAGIFAGRFFSEGFRLYQGNGLDEEFVPRPGPWMLYNVQGSINWKITPNLTFEISQLLSDRRNGNATYVQQPQWGRRDTRDVAIFDYGYGMRLSPVWDGPTELWDAVTIGRLLYGGDQLGTFEALYSYRRADQRITGISWFGLSDQRWIDSGLSFKYFRTDKYSVATNEFTMGSDLWDGKFGRESRQIVQTYGTNAVEHQAEQSGYRESLSYYVMNQTRFWDRLYVDLGYRIENYDLPDLFANNESRVVTNAKRIDRKKSASQWSFGLVYDRELGSSMYYKHSRMYRFPEFYDMVNLGIFGLSPDPPFWLLDPEEGTLEEVGIRHWFNRNIYASAVYYELDMDNEILYGMDQAGNQRNLNVQNVSHSGIELECLLKITPSWTVKGNFTKQKVLIRSNFLPALTPINQQTTEDKWLWQNPGEMGNLSLEYNNREWGFSGIFTYHYVGSRYRINDPYNIAEPLEPAKWGDLAISQSFFENAATVYFGIRNISDAQYAIIGTKSAPSVYSPLGTSVPAAWYPNEGRTCYAGIKANMDFERMKVPTREDLTRMQRRLFGSLQSGLGGVYGWGARISNLANF
ncbi:MAG: TonB-dependent receptor [Desulfomonile tiedjei]|uniref:TonB-dependent receptor n=1 Tax=Desulfomonile tiedjei TaxID=2358 RepID=A0A9D6V6D1_9BACT|nr:TonB-dependent receptor [Desulfomonile tiedjei]